MNRKELKTNAKVILKTHYWKILGLIILVSLLSMDFINIGYQINSYESYCYIQISNIKIPISLSGMMLYVFIALTAGFLFSVFFGNVLNYGLRNKLKYITLNQENDFDIFDGFRNNYKNIVKVQLVYNLVIILWSLLLVIPGIIKSYELQYVSEILEEHPDWEFSEIFAESKRLTYGHKWELFVLDLSFILWHLGTSLFDSFTFGMASYLLMPYTQITNVQAYFYLKELQKPLFENEYNFEV